MGLPYPWGAYNNDRLQSLRSPVPVLFCGQSSTVLLLCELSTSFKMSLDSPVGDISCAMAPDPKHVTPFPVLHTSAKEAHAKFSNMTSMGKNVNFNQVHGRFTLLLSYVFSLYVLLLVLITAISTKFLTYHKCSKLEE